MSRVKKCSVCGSAEDLISTGRCVWCEDRQDSEEARAEARESAAFREFLNQPDEDRWRQVWDVLRQSGHLG